MQPTEQLSYIIPTLNSLVDRVPVDALIAPTPCDKFTVHDVLDHMMVLGGSFAYWFRGEEAPEIKAPPVYGVVPNREFRRSMDDLLEAVNSPGAMERTIATPMGDMPGETFARFVAFDGLMHGWDIATATDLTFDLPPSVVEAADQFARAALTPQMRDGDTFKDPTTAPGDATAIAKLAAFSGRSV